MSRVSLFLPVIWAAVSTVVALLLYRTSSAFFSQTEKNKSGTRVIRLTGSVVIAAVAFLGMKAATPSQLLLGEDPGLVSVSVSQLDELSALSITVEQTSLALSGCLAAIVNQSCLDKARTLSGDTARLRQGLSDLRPQTPVGR
jgi:hypothetical protein